MAASGAPLFQAATANLNPWTEAKVDTDNPDRGPPLLISGEQDHTVPWAIANASDNQQKDKCRVTQITEGSPWPNEETPTHQQRSPYPPVATGNAIQRTGHPRCAPARQRHDRFASITPLSLEHARRAHGKARRSREAI